MIRFPHPPQPYGGPGSFQLRFQSFLEKNNIKYLTHISPPFSPGDSILIVNGSRQILNITKAKTCGVRLVFRIDGRSFSLNRYSSFSKIIKSLLYDALKVFLLLVADYIVCQSFFIYKSWRPFLRILRKPVEIIVNPSPADTSRLDSENLPAYLEVSTTNLLSVEGSIEGQIAHKIFQCMRVCPGIELTSFGRLNLNIDLEALPSNVAIMGRCDREQIQIVMKSRHWIFICLEDYPPCPNSVIEALSNGIPVIGFAQGSLPQLVFSAGILLPSEALTRSDEEIASLLIHACNIIRCNYDYYRRQALQVSKNFDQSLNFSRYLGLLLA
jgi:glycosyltransferase involved in cell wall biosynthesis